MRYCVPSDAKSIPTGGRNCLRNQGKKTIRIKDLGQGLVNSLIYIGIFALGLKHDMWFAPIISYNGALVNRYAIKCFDERIKTFDSTWNK